MGAVASCCCLADYYQFAIFYVDLCGVLWPLSAYVSTFLPMLAVFGWFQSEEWIWFLGAGGCWSLPRCDNRDQSYKHTIFMWSALRSIRPAGHLPDILRHYHWQILLTASIDITNKIRLIIILLCMRSIAIWHRLWVIGILKAHNNKS